MTRDKPDDGPPPTGEMSESEIDRTLADTFPASDPPSWTLGSDHRADPPEEDPVPEADDKDPERGA